MVTLKLKIGDPREYRSSIGPAKSGFLVFKGQLKIGMVPLAISEANPALFSKTKVGRVKHLLPEKKTLTIEI